MDDSAGGLGLAAIKALGLTWLIFFDCGRYNKGPCEPLLINAN